MPNNDSDERSSPDTRVDPIQELGGTTIEQDSCAVAMG